MPLDAANVVWGSVPLSATPQVGGDSRLLSDGELVVALDTVYGDCGSAYIDLRDDKKAKWGQFRTGFDIAGLAFDFSWYIHIWSHNDKEHDYWSDFGPMMPSPGWTSGWKGFSTVAPGWLHDAIVYSGVAFLLDGRICYADRPADYNVRIYQEADSEEKTGLKEATPYQSGYPEERWGTVAARVMASWPRVLRWSLPTEGLVPVLLGMASPTMRGPNSELRSAGSGILVAYLGRLSRYDRSPPGGSWWGFKVGTSEDVLDSSQLHIPLPAPVATHQAALSWSGSQQPFSIHQGERDWWWTSVMPVEGVFGDEGPIRVYTCLMGRDTPIPLPVLRLEGTESVEPFLQGRAQQHAQYSPP